MVSFTFVRSQLPSKKHIIDDVAYEHNNINVSEINVSLNERAHIPPESSGTIYHFVGQRELCLAGTINELNPCL